MTGGFAWTAGHSQAFIPEVIQIADMTGAYGVSFVILLVNGCVYFMMRQRRLFAVYSAVGAVVIAVVLGYGYVTIRQGSGGEICLVCVVQPDILSREKADPARIDELTDRHLALTRQCFEGARLPDLVVWPETAVAEDVARDRIVNHKIRAFIREHSVRMLVGSAMMIEGKNYNSAVLFQENGQIEGIYHKQHLLPFHEFFPFENLTAGLQNRLRLKNYDFHRGREAGALPLEQGRADKSFGAAICSEEGYPGVFRRAASDGAGLMIAMLNDAWFESQAAMMLHAQTGLMHAAAFKLPLVRGSNNGLSCAADRYGRLRRSGRDSRLEQEAVFVFDVEPRPSMTAYARHGDIFVLVCAVVSMMILWNTRQEQGDAQNGDQDGVAGRRGSAGGRG